MSIRLWTLALIVGFPTSCSAKESEKNSVSVEYYSADGKSGLVYKADTWSNSPLVYNFSMSEGAFYAPYEVQVFDNGDVCLNHGANAHSFGSFGKPSVGKKLLCGSTSLEVIRCLSANCSDYLTSGVYEKKIEIRGERPRKVQLGFLQIANKCKGVVSIQWGLTKRRVQERDYEFPLGTALELRTNVGLLNKPELCG